jgi:tetratricopeptide (TPR) repeat protein
MKLLLAAAIAIALPHHAHADPKAEAQKHLETAAAAYKQKRWQDVLDALNKAYALDPKPELHFSIGQVYVKMGRCPDAIVSYEQFIASKPNGSNVDMAKEAIAACKAAAIVQPDPGPVEPPPPVDPPPVDPPPPKDDPPPNIIAPPPQDTGTAGRWYQDKVGVALVGGGAAFVFAGAVTYLLARGTLGDAEDAPSYEEQVDLYDSARGKRTISVVFTVVGLAAGGAGAYWYLKKRPAEQRGVGFVPAQDGGLVTWSGGF